MLETVKAVKLKNYMNGEWLESQITKHEGVYNPATKEVMNKRWSL